MNIRKDGALHVWLTVKFVFWINLWSYIQCIHAMTCICLSFTGQYKWSFDIFLLKLRSVLVCLSGTDAVLLQSNFVRRTCSRSLHSNCLGRGLNLYSPRYRSSALTDRPTCHTNELIIDSALFQWEWHPIFFPRLMWNEFLNLFP